MRPGQLLGLPLLFMIISSFKPDLQIFADLTSIKAFLPVGELSLDNYRAILDQVSGALGIKSVGGEVLPTSEHPTEGGNANARRRDYAAGTQTSTGSG